MRALLEHHTYLAILLVLFCEDLGIPLPIPADVVIMYGGYRMRLHALSPIVAPLLMLLAINGGAGLLYFIIRQGGRPLIDRFGPYLDLSPERLERAEVWLKRRGFWGIVLSRSIPGVRIATVISCALLHVPARVFLPAQLLGTMIYAGAFLAIGYFVGPQAVERIHLPAISIRVLLCAAVAVGLPWLLRRLNRDTAADQTGEIERGLRTRQRESAALLAGFAGAIELSLVLVVMLAPLQYMHLVQPGWGLHWLDHSHLGTAMQAHLPGRSGRALGLLIDILMAAAVSVMAALIFFHELMPRLRIGAQDLGRQIVALWIFAAVLVLVPPLLRMVVSLQWLPESGGPWLGREPSSRALWGLVLCLLPAAYVAVETRRLAIDRYRRTGPQKL